MMKHAEGWRVTGQAQRLGTGVQRERWSGHDEKIEGNLIFSLGVG